jgi:hypothetical protein
MQTIGRASDINSSKAAAAIQETVVWSAAGIFILANNIPGIVDSVSVSADASGEINGAMGTSTEKKPVAWTA